MIVLLLAAAGQVHASAEQRGAWRDELRAMQQAQKPARDQQDARHQPREERQHNSSGGGQAQPDDQRRQGQGRQMSPEQRRALRQQINEAGRELYTPVSR